MSHAFPPDERAAFYHVIETRRDIRAFRSDPIPEDILMKILGAAHHAPSVGLMQPWNFIVIHDRATKARVHALFLQENQAAAANYEGPRAALYRTLKLEGIEDAPVNVCVTCDRTRGGPHVLGRNTIVDTDLFSTCCAIENLWLAARVEGIGVGWVSILNNDELRGILGIPEPVVPVAYLCIGYAQEFLDEPELQRRGWAHRLPLGRVIYHERWEGEASDPGRQMRGHDADAIDTERRTAWRPLGGRVDDGDRNVDQRRGGRPPTASIRRRRSPH